MISPLASTVSGKLTATQFTAGQAANPQGKDLEERKAFQQFAAGTFYQTMIKALRSTERETKYLNGGRAEKIFRGEFDQRVAASLADEHGEQLAGPLFEQFISKRQYDATGITTPASSAQRLEAFA